MGCYRSQLNMRNACNLVSRTFTSGPIFLFGAQCVNQYSSGEYLVLTNKPDPQSLLEFTFDYVRGNPTESSGRASPSTD